VDSLRFNLFLCALINVKIYYKVNELKTCLKTCVTFINHEVTSLQSFFFISSYSFFSFCSQILATYPALYEVDTTRGKVKQTFYLMLSGSMPGALLIFAGELRRVCLSCTLLFAQKTAILLARVPLFT